MDDTALIFPHFTVMKASAGSGKTYALARRFVLFLLSDDVPNNRLNNLLAITFSNNAAKEMKQRILDLLKKIHLGNEEAIAEFSAALSLSPPVIIAKAGAVVDEILSDYSDFQVKTIDSFMTTVFKASAIDFGFSPDFEIVMNNASLMGYAFALFLRRVREGTEESVFMNGIIDTMLANRPGESPYPWEPTGEILREIEEIYRRLAACGKSLTTGDDSALMEGVRREIAAAMKELEDLIRESTLTARKSSSYENVLSAVKAARFPDLVGRGMKSPPVCKPRDDKDREAYERVLLKWEDLSGLVAAYTRTFACTYYTPYLKAYEGFSEILERAKRLEGKIFIEDVNKKLAEYLSSDMALDIYFRLGEVIFHYLIDEFQDTSPVQWHNLFPLLENSLSQGGSLFVVGDTKQAIYGFRDADYTIMKSVETDTPFPSARHCVQELHVNYRSDGAIVSFAENVFHRMLPLQGDYGKAGEETGLTCYRQAVRPEKADQGYVQTYVLERDDEEPQERAKLYELVEDLLKRGYRHADITVLTPRNSDVVKVTTWLNAKGIPFLSYSSLDVRRRKITGEIIALLEFLDSPVNDLAFATFILGDVFKAFLEKEGRGDQRAVLQEMCFRNREHDRRPLYKAFQEEMEDLWERCFETLFRHSGYLPLYDLVVSLYAVFDLFKLFGDSEEGVLAKVLESIKDLEAEGGGSLRAFLQAAALSENGETDWNIDIPYGIEAVKVMTIHKAKGLGFPVVILLLYGEKSKGFRHILREDQDSVTLLRLTKRMLEVDDDFDRRYAEEEMKDRVNRLNSLYVAFTRAGAELYVIGVKRERETFPFSLFPDNMSYCAGERPQVAARAKAEQTPVDAFHHSEPLRIVGSDPADHILFEEKRRGEFAHRVLSFVDYVDENLESRVDGFVSRTCAEEGTEVFAEGLRRGIPEFLRSPAVSGYYERRPDRTVMMEKELVDRQGRLFRVDRIVVDPDRMTIIEYKTGSDRDGGESHLAQMRNYLSVVRDAYPDKPVEGMIAYIDLKKVRGVGKRVEWLSEDGGK